MRRLGALGACVLLAGCGGGGGSGSTLERGSAVEGFAITDASEVADGRPIAARFTCDGEDVAPRLVWEAVPDGTKELALVVDDPDAPDGTFTHLLVWGLDPGTGEWTGGGPLAGTEGENDFGDVGYGGPCPPHGEEHRYVFRVLALDARLPLDGRADRSAFDEALSPHVLGEARLTATYARE
jgi:Raf kinase inhibitor-like YbhB/YbcL family protein